MRKTIILSTAIAVTALINTSKLLAQNCSVLLDSINGTYAGDCKKGKAEGKGEAKGICRYKGEFEAGMPNGSGTYFYSDSNYFIGNFLYGVKEGKGEWHQKINGTDSVTKGYWSGNMYTGNTYIPYKFTTAGAFDRTQVYYSKSTGNTVKFEIRTTSGSPDGTANSLSGGNGTVLNVTEVYSEDGKRIVAIADNATANSYSITFLIPKFPLKLFGYFSDGSRFDIELNRSATWSVNLFLNR